MKRFLPEPRTFRLGLNGLIAFSITVSSLNTAPCLIQAKSSAKTCAACANTGILPKEKAESDDTSKTDSKTNTKSDTKTDSEINAADSVRAFGSGLVHFNDLNQSNARQTDLQKHAEGAAENTTQNPDKKQSLEDMRQRKKAVQTACAASAKTRKKETGSASDSRKDDSKTSSTNQAPSLPYGRARLQTKIAKCSSLCRKNRCTQKICAPKHIRSCTLPTLQCRNRTPSKNRTLPARQNAHRQACPANRKTPQTKPQRFPEQSVRFFLPDDISTRFPDR